MELDEKLIEQLISRPTPSYVLDPQITGKTVLVTGAGGFIGSRLCEELVKHKPKVLLMVEQCEYALYKVDQTLQNCGVPVIPVLSSYGSTQIMDGLLNGWAVDRVYHVGAYKHVPLVERNPLPAVQNNVLDFRKFLRVLESKNLPELVVVSSDKAVKPTNIMGCTKRLVEQLAQASTIPDVKCVRFGNVLWSTGSVLPVFYQQLRKGQALTITHEQVDRYFMSVGQAVCLILQSIALTDRGVYVFDMGQPVKIRHIAEELAEAMGVVNPEVKIVGLRPGEKLHEELTLGDQLLNTSHPEILYAKEDFPSSDVLENVVFDLEQAMKAWDVGYMRRVLQTIVPGYNPSCGIVCDTFLRRFVFDAREQLGDCYALPMV